MVNTNMHVFKHPKYYKELRDAGNELAPASAVKEDLACSGSSPARNKSDQAISLRAHDGECERAPDPGHKQQASSYKLPGPRPISNANKGLIHKPSFKHQASSFKRQAPEAASHKPQAPSIKAQASSHKHQAP
jgi:hypothetical protein